MKKVFYGWYIVLACVLIAAAGIGFHNTASIFVRPVTEDLGFSRGEFTFFRTIITILSAGLLPFYGKLAARYSIKKIMLVGTSINGLTLMAYSFGTQLWHFYLIATVSGLFVNAGNFMIIGILISRWFEDKKGLALGIAFAGSGFGAAIMNPMASHVIELYGWQMGYLFSGIAALVVLIPIVLFLVKDKPEDMGLEAYRLKDKTTTNVTSTKSEGLTLAEARKTPLFWLLAVALLGISVSASAPNAHTVPYLSDLGYSAAMVSSVIAFSMVFLTVGKIFMGYVFDRFGILVGGLALGIFCILSPTFALLALNPAAPWLHAIFLGLASTGFSLTANIYAMNFFGNKDFPAILSILSVITAIGAAFSPPLMGLAYDFLSSYTIAWIALVITGAIVTLCLAGATIMNMKRSSNGN